MVVGPVLLSDLFSTATQPAAVALEEPYFVLAEPEKKAANRKMTIIDASFVFMATAGLRNFFTLS